MTAALGELLAALHGAGEVRTVRATIRTWTHLARAHEAFVAGAQGTVWTALAVSAGPVPEEMTTVHRVWRAFPDRGRVESDDSLAVRRGGLWWTWHRDYGAMTNEGDEADVRSDAGTEFDHLFVPWPLAGTLRFEVLGEGTRTGRAATLARAVPLGDEDERRWGPNDLPEGADEYVLAVDREHGTLLELVARRGGEEFSRTEVVEIAFDEPLDDELFVFRAPDGSEPRTTEPSRVDAFLSAAELAARAPFPVFQPREVPVEWHVDRRFMHDPPEAYLLYHSPDIATRLTITERSAEAPRDPRDALDVPDAWRELGSYRVREPAESWADTLVRCVREGTEIELASHDMDVDALVEVAEMLVLVSAEPPRFA